MQPLDLCVFGPFKQFYTQAANDWMLSNPGKAISIHDIAQIVGVSYPLAFTPKNIKSGFCASGIYPRNSNIFTDKDYLAAYVTDRPQPVTTGPTSTNTTVGLTTNHDTIQSATNETVATISDDRPILQSATTETVATTSHDTVQSSSILYSPEDLRPFPKAPARKTVAGRKRATTRILTSTPVKTAVEQELKL